MTINDENEIDAPFACKLVDRMTEAELSVAARVQRVLPVLREVAARADREAQFQTSHIGVMRDAGLLGMVIPETYGGLGGSLRDLAGATFALGSACPSTALAFFFHCSAASRGLLALEALDAGLFTPEEAPVVRAFAERLLTLMGREGAWMSNFASESVKTAKAAVTISTTATPTAGGYRLSGVKAFGCSTGVATHYLVTAKLDGHENAEGLGLFLVDPRAAGVKERAPWDALGMRGSATHGIELKDVFVRSQDALAIPGAFVRMMQVSRGSFVGNQLAATAVYLGAAQAAYDAALQRLTTRKLADTGESLASASAYHLELIGKMTADLETGYVWLRRQLELETSEPPLASKAEVVRQWRLCKGEVCEACFRVATTALRACGTSATGNRGPIARAIRDLSMGLVQAFPAERGRLEAARMVVNARAQALMGAQ